MINLKKLITESKQFENAELKETIRDSRPEYFHRCPHCNEEIYEMHTWVDESGVDHHSDCGGAIKFHKTKEEIEETERFLKHFGIK